MEPSTVIAIQQLISAAVTPVVMISACATLVLVINSKLSNISDRMRALAVEFRRNDITFARRRQLLDQKRVFQLRYNLTYVAHMLLNAAIIAFILTVPIILLTEHHKIATNAPTLALFLSGVVLMLFAMICELVEISFSLVSIRIEMRDIVFPPDHPGSDTQSPAP